MKIRAIPAATALEEKRVNRLLRSGVLVLSYNIPTMKMAATPTFLPVDIRKFRKARIGSSNVIISPTVLRTFKLTSVSPMAMQVPLGGGLGKNCSQKKDIGVHWKMHTRAVATDQAVT